MALNLRPIVSFFRNEIIDFELIEIMNEILNNKRTRLTLFENSIVVDKKLPKWINAEANIRKEDKNNYLLNGNTILPYNLYSDPDGYIDSSTKWLPLYETPEGVSFNELATAGLKDLNRIIAEKKIKYVLGGYGSFGLMSDNSSDNGSFRRTFKESTEKESLTEKAIKWLNRLKKKKSSENSVEFDAIKFFSLVKVTSKESVSTYKYRVSKYLIALHNAAKIGQTAMVEQLLREMVANRYESVLFAEGYYYAITEEQMVDFVKKCEKGIRLDYLKNYSRVIPNEVVDKIDKVNQLEIFDNYVVLYYDPDGKVYKETAKEEAKRKDPIIFGVIASSKKLYYITDWIDEYCYLTLEQFVDTLGITTDDVINDSFKGEIAAKPEKPKKTRKRKTAKEKEE